MKQEVKAPPVFGQILGPELSSFWKLVFFLTLFPASSVSVYTRQENGGLSDVLFPGATFQTWLPATRFLTGGGAGRGHATLAVPLCKAVALYIHSILLTV